MRVLWMRSVQLDGDLLGDDGVGWGVRGGGRVSFWAGGEARGVHRLRAGGDGLGVGEDCIDRVAANSELACVMQVGRDWVAAEFVQ